MRELNLIPYEIKQKRIMHETLIKTGVIALLVIILLSTAAIIPYAKLRILNAKELVLKAEIDDAKPIIAENEKLRKETASYKEYIDLVDKIQKSNVPVTPIFKNLQKYIPQDVFITSFSLNAGKININASAKNYDSIDEFDANLQESKEFASSNITGINRDEKTEEYTFTLIITTAKGEVK